MDKSTPTLISNVPKICKEKGLTINQFAGRMLLEQGIGDKTARMIFRGGTNLYARTIAKTALVLGVPFGDVLRFKNGS